MIYAAVFGALDVIVILTLATQSRFYIIERLFVVFVSIIGFGYLYEIFVTKPDPLSIMFHSVVPSLANNNAVLLAVGVIGATVMPHALFVHSWLTKNKVQQKPLEERRRIRKLHLVENIILLTIAGVVNAAIMIMAATAFHSYNPGVASISEAYKTLVPLFGATAGIIFLLTLLSSGIASSVVGTLAGQAIMEGLIGKKVNLWLRRFITRFINVIPTTIAILLGLDPLNILVYSQVILSIMIPIPMIPLVLVTMDSKLMGEFVNKKTTTIIAVIFVGIILVFNSYLLFSIIGIL
jgi:manganese transport protein